MEKGDGGNKKKKEEIFHVGQIEKQNDKMKEQKERMEAQISLLLQNTWTCITFHPSETFTKERVCVTVLTVFART